MRNLALAAKAANVKQFVLVSSAGAGRADSYPSSFMKPFLQANAAGEFSVRVPELYSDSVGITWRGGAVWCKGN